MSRHPPRTATSLDVDGWKATALMATRGKLATGQRGSRAAATADAVDHPFRQLQRRGR
jgi:hypothetical protein